MAKQKQVTPPTPTPIVPEPIRQGKKNCANPLCQKAIAARIGVCPFCHADQPLRHPPKSSSHAVDVPSQVLLAFVEHMGGIQASIDAIESLAGYDVDSILEGLHVAKDWAAQASLWSKVKP